MQQKRDQAEETLDCLNRIIHDNPRAENVGLGTVCKVYGLFKKTTERKSAQYYPHGCL